MNGVSCQGWGRDQLMRRRVPVSPLPTPAKALAVAVEELLGEAPKAGKRGPTPKLQ